MSRAKWIALYGVGLAGTAVTSAGLGVLTVEARWALLATDAVLWVLCVAGSTVALIRAKAADQ